MSDPQLISAVSVKDKMNQIDSVSTNLCRIAQDGHLRSLWILHLVHQGQLVQRPR